MQLRLAHTRTAHGRSAFTLLDLAAVMLVVGVLASLVLPGGVSRRPSPVARVSAEIRQLEAGLIAFHDEFGCTPPSSVTLVEAGGTWDAISTAKIRRLWPNFDFELNRDLDGDGEHSGRFELCGSECLVFFLGGMPVKSGDTLTVSGFSKKPDNPFAPIDIDRMEDRDGPYYEFKPARLRLCSRKANPFLVYLDPLPSQTMPYIYASSYEGQGYATVELNVAGNQVLNNGVYQVGNTGQAQKPKSYQIISPGFDNTFGLGGPYDANQTNGLLTNINDYDNITNFSTGQLVSNR